MAESTELSEPAEASQREKTIEVRIRFFTNDIAETEDEVLPRHVWFKGVLILVKNDTHGIKPAIEHFRGPLDLLGKLGALLREGGVALHLPPGGWAS